MYKQQCAGNTTLKESVYAIREPVLDQYIALRGAQPKPAPLHLATICPATAECREELARLAATKLSGIPHDLVRVDPEFPRLNTAPAA